MFTNGSLFFRNNPNDQSRDLKPSLPNNQNPYSASPSQLTLPSDLQGGGGIPNPYQQYGYVPSPHDPTAFAFPTHTGYRPQLQTHYNPQPSQYQQHSPTNSRKRRASELGDPSIPGSSGSSASAYTNPTGLVTGGSELGVLDPTAPSQQQLPSPTVKKGRTNTPWTPAEEQRLKTLREAGSSWSEIAKTFPTRTEGSVKKHWYKVRMLPSTAVTVSTTDCTKGMTFFTGYALCGVCGRRGQQFRSPHREIEGRPFVLTV